MFKRQKSREESDTASRISSVADSKSSGSQFKVVGSSKRRSVNAGHPSGWVNRVQEKETFAKAGLGPAWKCDAFDVKA